MEPIQKGKQANKTSNMCTSDKGKQTNKQVEAAHVEAWMQGVVQSCVTCRVQYTMCQSMQKSFGDALEMCQKSMEFDTQGRTLTQPPAPSQPGACVRVQPCISNSMLFQCIYNASPKLFCVL